jgi:hypothetical protein
VWRQCFVARRQCPEGQKGHAKRNPCLVASPPQPRSNNIITPTATAVGNPVSANYRYVVLTGDKAVSCISSQQPTNSASSRRSYGMIRHEAGRVALDPSTKSRHFVVFATLVFGSSTVSMGKLTNPLKSIVSACATLCTQ